MLIKLPRKGAQMGNNRHLTQEQRYQIYGLKKAEWVQV